MIHYPNELDNPNYKFNDSGFNKLKIQKDGTFKGVSFFNSDVVRIREFRVKFTGKSKVKPKAIINCNLQSEFYNKSLLYAEYIKLIELESNIKSKINIISHCKRLRLPNHIKASYYKFNKSSFNKLEVQEKETFKGVSFFNTDIVRIKEVKVKFTGESKVFAKPIVDLNLQIKFNVSGFINATTIRGLYLKSNIKAESMLLSDSTRVRHPNRLENKEYKFNRSNFNRTTQDKSVLKGISHFRSIAIIGTVGKVIFNSLSKLNAIAFKYMTSNIAFKSKSNLKVEQVRVTRGLSVKFTGTSKVLANAKRIRQNKGVLKGISYFRTRVTINTVGKVIFKSVSELNAIAFKYMTSNISFKSKSNLKVEQVNVAWSLSVKFNGTSKVLANANTIQTEEINVSGISFRPNDVIRIDLNNYYVTQNGVDITHRVDGDFFNFYSQENTLIWKDDVTQRKVRIETLYQNKYL